MNKEALAKKKRTQIDRLARKYVRMGFGLNWDNPSGRFSSGMKESGEASKLLQTVDFAGVELRVVAAMGADLEPFLDRQRHAVLSSQPRTTMRTLAECFMNQKASPARTFVDSQDASL